MAAAVADYAPDKPSKEKIKKSGNKLTIDLSLNPDIAFDLGKLKKKGQVLVGFALETNDAIKNAKKKLAKKKFDFIVINSLSDKGAGFNSDTNKISILDKDNKIQHFELKGKDIVAIDITDKLCTYFGKK
jgi:phosphopantothenoylcysteine decarboxylase/phosphopantothenate--cysteine ligase